MKNTTYAVIAIMAITALLTIPTGINQSEARSEIIYHPEMVAYIKEVISNTGTATSTRTDDGKNFVTTNTVTKDGSAYTVHTTTTVDGYTINDETITITQNDDGTYGFVNEARDMDIIFTNNEYHYLQGWAYNAKNGADIVLHDRAYAEEGEVISLTDDHKGCWGNYATFTAGVDTTSDTYMTWDAKLYYVAYCFLPQFFDKVEITHEGHNVTSELRKSNLDMWNSNGEGWYSATVKVYYD